LEVQYAGAIYTFSTAEAAARRSLKAVNSGIGVTIHGPFLKRVPESLNAVGGDDLHVWGLNLRANQSR